MKLYPRCCIFFLAFICLFFTATQDILAQTKEAPSWKGTRPSGIFLQDSLKVGSPVSYSLSLRHPADMEVIFPDSSYNFSPFEWISKEYFPTHTNEAGSLDSVVYTLTSFDLAAVQQLALPIYIITRNDCTAVFAAPDSIYLQSLITSQLDSLQAKTHLEYMPVEPYYNYGYTILIAVAILMALLLINFAFGKQIRRQFKLYTISREHSQFRHAFDRLTRNIHADNTVDNVENAVILWKNYMESLEDKPFSTYTTKEIIEVIPNGQLAEALQHTDRVIYGQMASEESIRYTRILAYVAKRSYIEKRVSIEKQKL